MAQWERRSFASSRFGVRIPVVPQRTEREAQALREYCTWYHAGKRRRSVERGRSSDGQSNRPEAGGRGFESRRPHVRSWGCSSMGEHLSGRKDVPGSNPGSSTGDCGAGTAHSDAPDQAGGGGCKLRYLEACGLDPVRLRITHPSASPLFDP
jgi:hypothetical protein